MPRLIDLNPAWVDLPSQGRRGLGVFFDCMLGHCEVRNMILFANPLDGGPPWPGESRSLMLELFKEEEPRWMIAGCGTCRWNRIGETFETLSMHPSVDAHACGHFTLTNGAFA